MDSMTYKMLEPIIREKLSTGGRIIIKPKGTSMLPLIRQGVDEVELAPPPNVRLKKYDIPFYKRKNGQFVLHRIVDVKKDSYVLCGDNQTELEYGITDDMIIAVVTRINRGGEFFEVSNKQYLKYCKNLVGNKTKQRLLLKIKRIIKKILFQK